MPSLTSEPITWPARQTSATAALPRARFAPNSASAISAVHTTGFPPVMNADTTSEPTGSCSRFTTLVLAHAVSSDWPCALSCA